VDKVRPVHDRRERTRAGGLG